MLELPIRCTIEVSFKLKNIVFSNVEFASVIQVIQI